MNAAEARANADALRAKALALYAEAKALRDGPSWRESVQRALIAKIAEANAVDDAFNDADVIARCGCGRKNSGAGRASHKHT